MRFARAWAAAAMASVVVAAGAGIASADRSVRVDNKTLANDADGTNWAAYGRTFAETHYSPLKQITDRNIGRLGLVAFTDLPRASSVVSAPLAIDGVLYLAVGLSVVHAVDAKSGKVLWRYDPGVAAVAGDMLKPAWGIRGIAFWNGKVYTGTQDGRLIALDAKRGTLIWSAATTQPNDGLYITGAPRVFNGKVVIGNGGADTGPVRGYVTAYDANNGRQLWRFYTVPGDPAKGFEDEAMRMAAKTWSGTWWKFGGGGTVWNSMTYDPDFNRLYLGVGNGSPWNQHIRSPGGGDNLFLSSIVALDADTGRYVWHYQVNPGESWDYSCAMDMELAQLSIAGRMRRVILHAPKNGFFYVIDRETGKLLTAEKFAKANWAERIDLETGRPVENPQARFAREPFLMFPGSAGAHGPEAMSFNPMVGLVFIPAREVGRVYTDANIDRLKWKHESGIVTFNVGLSPAPANLVPPPPASELVAWDPVNQKRVWAVPTPGNVAGGTSTSAGNLVFQGQADGQFIAYAADTGKRLWSFDAQVGILAQPISYAVSGKQYVSVIAGYGGVNAVVSGAKFGWDYATQPRRVLTFALDGTLKLPPAETYRFMPADDPRFTVDPNLARIGAAAYNKHCVLCHGFGAVSGGAAPDLRASGIPLSRDAFATVVRQGALVPAGMPRFDELTDDELTGIMHYIRSAARSATRPATSSETKSGSSAALTQ